MIKTVIMHIFIKMDALKYSGVMKCIFQCYLAQYDSNAVRRALKCNSSYIVMQYLFDEYWDILINRYIMTALEILIGALVELFVRDVCTYRKLW